MSRALHRRYGRTRTPSMVDLERRKLSAAELAVLRAHPPKIVDKGRGRAAVYVYSNRIGGYMAVSDWTAHANAQKILEGEQTAHDEALRRLAAKAGAR